MDSIPSLLGLALRAGRLAVGEEPVGTACRCHKGYLLLLASDAADNTIRRALHFSQAGKTICLTLPLTKEELGSGLGRRAPGPGRPGDLRRSLADLSPEGRPRETAPGRQALPQQEQGEAQESIIMEVALFEF